jgi:hypothetical protein
MSITSVRLSDKISVDLTCWEGFADSLELNYVNQSTDHWHGDFEVSIDITKNEAEELIKLLQLFVDRN